MSDATDVHHHPELKRKVYSALQEGDEGKRSIAIPKEVSLRQSGHRVASGIVSEGEHSLVHVLLHISTTVRSRYTRTSNSSSPVAPIIASPRIHAHSHEHWLQHQESGGWYSVRNAFGTVPNSECSASVDAPILNRS